jgi:hypothetical protein
VPGEECGDVFVRGVLHPASISVGRPRPIDGSLGTPAMSAERAPDVPRTALTPMLFVAGYVEWAASHVEALPNEFWTR